MAVKKITIINRENKIFKVSNRKPLLQELRAQGLDLPYGCEYGGCITCAAKLIKGEIDQRSQVALNNRQINNGYVVLCVAKPKTDCEIEQIKEAIGMDSKKLKHCKVTYSRIENKIKELVENNKTKNTRIVALEKANNELTLKNRELQKMIPKMCESWDLILGSPELKKH